MKGIFGARKGKAVKFDYYINIHTLTPWPTQYSALAVAYARGAHKGMTKAVRPAVVQPGQLWTSYDFEEAFHIPCTLYQEGKQLAGRLGPFEKKWLVLGIVEGDPKARGKEPLGRVVVNLSDYAAEDARGTQTCTVACRREISSAVGEVKMLITIGCRIKGKDGPGMMATGSDLGSTPSYSESGSDEFGMEGGGIYDTGSSTRATHRMQSIPEVAASAMATTATPAPPPAQRYDEDGFLIDDDDDMDTPRPASANGMSAESGGASRGVARRGTEGTEEGTSEGEESDEDFLAQAVAAMESTPRVTKSVSFRETVERAEAGPLRSEEEEVEQEEDQLEEEEDEDDIMSKALEAMQTKPDMAASSQARTAAPPIKPGRPEATARGSSDGGDAGGSEASPFVQGWAGKVPPLRGSPPGAAAEKRGEGRSPAPAPTSLETNPFLQGRSLKKTSSTSPDDSKTAAGMAEGSFRSNPFLQGRAGSGEAAAKPVAAGPLADPVGKSQLPAEKFFLREDGPTPTPGPAGDAAAAAGASTTPRSDADGERWWLNPAAAAAGGSPSAPSAPSAGASSSPAVAKAVPQADPPISVPEPTAAASELPTAESSKSENGSTDSEATKPVAAAVRRFEPRPAASKFFSKKSADSSPVPEKAAPVAVANRDAARAGTSPETRHVRPESRESIFYGDEDDMGPDSLLAASRSMSRSRTQREATSVEGGSPTAPRLDSGGGSGRFTRISRSPSPPSHRKAEVGEVAASGLSNGSLAKSPLGAAGKPTPPSPAAAGKLPPPTPAEPSPGSEIYATPQSSPPVGARIAPAPGLAPANGAIKKGVTGVVHITSADSASPSPGGTREPSPAVGTRAGPPDGSDDEGEWGRKHRRGGKFSPSADDDFFRVHNAVPTLSNGMTLDDCNHMKRELLTVAALEASVYLARSRKGASRRVKSRSVHAPARRLARTTISLGPEEGIVFGLRSIRVIEAAADGASDVVGMAYWWSNAIQLRWMLWAMCHGSGEEDAGPEGTVNEFDWVMQVLVPPLRKLETSIFETMVGHLWSGVLLEALAADRLAGAPLRAYKEHSREEAAVQRWLEALQSVHRALLPASEAATSGHVMLLKQKALAALLRRLDALLFTRLVIGEEGEGNGRVSFSGRTGREEEAEALDKKLLPFSPGRISFGVGIQLKMAVARWAEWAADVGLHDDKRGTLEGSTLFPQLRGAADLLMMNKERLTNKQLRADVAPGLALSRICSLLERYQPDEDAPEPLPRGLLEVLRNETAGGDTPSAEIPVIYEPPSEAALLADGLIEPVSLEMDYESEEEVGALAEMYDQQQLDEGTQRFSLLRDLWASAR